MEEIDTTFFVDLDHGKDVKRGKYMTGLTGLEAPVLSEWGSHRQPSA